MSFSAAWGHPETYMNISAQWEIFHTENRKQEINVLAYIFWIQNTLSS